MAKGKSEDKAVTALDAAKAANPWDRRPEQQAEINGLPMEQRMEIMAEDQAKWQAHFAGEAAAQEAEANADGKTVKPTAQAY